MAAGTDDVNIKFGATIDDVKAKMGELSGIFTTVAARFAAIAAVAAGGAAFGKFIEEANEANVAAEKMARTLGISATEAGVLAVAIDDIASKMGVNAGPETYTAAFLKFNRALASSSDELRALGVDVGAFQNGTKTSNDLFLESLQLFEEYAPGIDQTQFAMKAFGKSVQEVQVLSQLNAKALADARKAAQDLNLTITAEGVKAAENYRVAMDNVGDVLQGIGKTIGEAVMPHFTRMAERMASIGPVLVEGIGAAIQIMVTLMEELGAVVSAVWDGISEVLGLMLSGFREVFGTGGPSAMEIFKNSIKVVQIAIVTFSTGVQQMVSLVTTGLQLTISWFNTFAAVARAVLSGQGWSGAKAALQAGVDERVKIVADGARRMAELGRGWMEKVDSLVLGTPAGTPAAPPKGGTKTVTLGKAGAEDPRLAANLALQRAQAQAQAALELEYLKQAGAMYDDAYKNGLISTEQFYAARLAIEQRGLDASLEAKRKELRDAEAAEAAAAGKKGGAKNTAERNKAEAEIIKFQTEQVKLQGEINVLEAKRVDTVRQTGRELEDVQKKLGTDLELIRAGRAKAAADGDVEMERQALEQKKALRQISAQEAFAAEMELEQRSYAATMTALAAKRAAITGSADEVRRAREQADAESEAAQLQHQQRMTAIANQAELERRKFSLQAQQSIQNGFSTMIGDLLNGVTKVSDVMRRFAMTVANTFTNLIAQKFTERLFDAGGVNKAIDKMVDFVIEGIGTMVAKWLGFETAKTVAAQAGAATRVATDSAVAATALATQQSVSIAAVMGWASVAAAAAMASVAAIPIVGWAMAPGVGATTYALGLGYLATAAGGWGEVEQDQMAYVHKKEMVLPAKYAEGLRGMLEAWQAPANPIDRMRASMGGGGDSPAPARQQSMPPVQLVGHSSGDFFIANRKQLLKVLKDSGRDFGGAT